MSDILHSWVGRYVHIEVLSGVGPRTLVAGQKPGYGLGMSEAAGILEEVSERGIILTEERAGDLFFSWGAVLRIQPHEQDGVRRG